MKKAKRNTISFLESELPSLPPEEALFHIIPVPLEKSVSYGTGTGNGPSAILAASQELELFDGFSIPAEKGIFTHQTLNCDRPIENIFSEMAEIINTVFSDKKIPIILGGEHTVTIGALQALKKGGLEFGIIQLDAHADLRDSYQDNPFSHACVMRRAFEMKIPSFQIGVRSLSYEEHIFRKENNIKGLDALFLNENGIPEKILPLDFPERVFITIDVDAFDPALIPATGTPEPGGLSYFQVRKIIQKILQEVKIIGFDVVELAPVKDFHSPDFVIARLIYDTMGFISRNSN